MGVSSGSLQSAALKNAARERLGGGCGEAALKTDRRSQRQTDTRTYRHTQSRKGTEVELETLRHGEPPLPPAPTPGCWEKGETGRRDRQTDRPTDIHKKNKERTMHIHTWHQTDPERDKSRERRKDGRYKDRDTKDTNKGEEKKGKGGRKRKKRWLKLSSKKKINKRTLGREAAGKLLGP